MARVTLWDGEVRHDLLPAVCVVCGEPTDERKRVKFNWVHPLVFLAILVNLLIWLILSLVLRKTMTVRLPVCPRHRGHWFRRAAVLWGMLLGFVILAALSAVLSAQSPDTDLWAYVLAAAGGWLVIGLFAAAIMQANGVRPVEITDSSITLAGVSKTFRDTLEADRDRDEAEEDRRRAEGAARG